jgi:cytidylate kinase
MTASKQLIIAIDGPAGAGKSTVSKRLAKRLGYTYIDTGAMYRALAWKASQLGLSLNDEAPLTRLAETSTIALQGEPDQLRVFIDGREITGLIRSQHISEATSIISTIAGVRRALVAEQQRMGEQGGVVLDGRDIGTQVFPNADVKFYLDANIDVRTRRRMAEERSRGRELTMEQARQEVETRDRRDSQRAVSPLRRPVDAIYIDSSNMTVEQVVQQMLEVIQHG